MVLDISKCDDVPADGDQKVLYTKAAACGYKQGMADGLAETSCDDLVKRKVRDAYLIGAAVAVVLTLIVTHAI